MELIVADTSPVFYLHFIQHIELLPKLFGTVLLPEAVHAELIHPGAPEPVRQWATNLPPWVSVRQVAELNDGELLSLGAGERAAITLALSIHADMILIDERKGARVAIHKGFEVMGTLGILDRAAERGLVNLDYSLMKLKETNFRYRQEMLDALLAKWKKQ